MSDEIRERIHEFIGSATAASESRNQVVHSEWWTALDDNDQFLRRDTRSRTKLVTLDIPATNADLQRILAALLLAVQNCHVLSSEVLSYWSDQQPRGD